MRLQEIENKIAQNQAVIKELEKQVFGLSKENNQLSTLKEETRMKYFSEWIEIGQVFHVSYIVFMSGTLTGASAKDSKINSNPHLEQGDVFEIIKKNDKSFVIKITTKQIKERDSSNTWVKKVLHPNWTYRVYINEIYNFVKREENWKQSFETFILRKEALELLGI